MKQLSIIIGTRPNFIKVTRFKELAPRYNCEVKIIHTGQHFDKNMAEIFFDQFGLRPDVFLNIKPQSQLKQIAEIIEKLEHEFTENPPDVVLVPGDVNSTFAAGFVANRMGIPLGHIESGLRSRDMEMPEEVNRILTDQITKHYFITEKSGFENLKEEGKSIQNLHLVGNTMIDTLVKHDADVRASNILEKLGIEGKFCLMTIHRPSNVDKKEDLERIFQIIQSISEILPVVFPIHPRSFQRAKDFGLDEMIRSKSIHLCDPMGYFDFQRLVLESSVVITDSGGIQEETTFRQVPCITLRNNTERPITVEIGTNELMIMEIEPVRNAVQNILGGQWKTGEIPMHWDGHSTERILQVIKDD